jgi:hypothetical protein
VRFGTQGYDASRVSVQPSPEAVAESARSKSATPSGRLLLRMPPGLHGELALAAERDGTSLNGYITARLAEAVDRSPAGAPATAAEQPASRTIVWLLLANVVVVGLAGLAALAIVLVATLD